MAKDIISTPFDYPCDVPGPRDSDWGKFGNALPEGPSQTQGPTGEVQFATIKGGEQGGTAYGPGKK